MAPNKSRRSIHARVTPACPHSTSARKRTLREPSMEANLIASPLRAVLGWQVQHAACDVQVAITSCKPPTSDMQKRQDATNMAAAMQHTTRCMATPALVLVAFCRRNVDVLAWDCRIIRFHCLTLVAFLCYWRAQGKRTSKEPITRTKITTQTTGLYLGSREGTSRSFRCNCGELASSCCRWWLILVTS